MDEKKIEIRTRSKQQQRLRRNKEEMRLQIISFGLMIALTAVAFIGVGYESIANIYFIPFLLLLALIQVILQLYYFMHMKEKGHHVPQFFLYTGILFAAIFVLTFMTIIWV